MAVWAGSGPIGAAINVPSSDSSAGATRAASTSIADVLASPGAETDSGQSAIVTPIAAPQATAKPLRIRARRNARAYPRSRRAARGAIRVKSGGSNSTCEIPDSNFL